jgi:hypothetical protein|tara:strand:+ start:2201 stop:2383 length:183 start_codon:yes stop_codon:yes gene_type:complete
MEPIAFLIIVIPLALLNIILFFKVWGMTNNTHKIRAMLEAQRPDLIWNGAFEKYKEEVKD